MVWIISYFLVFALSKNTLLSFSSPDQTSPGFFRLFCGRWLPWLPILPQQEVHRPMQGREAMRTKRHLPGHQAPGMPTSANMLFLFNYFPWFKLRRSHWFALHWLILINEVSIVPLTFDDIQKLRALFNDAELSVAFLGYQSCEKENRWNFFSDHTWPDIRLNVHVQTDSSDHQRQDASSVSQTNRSFLSHIFHLLTTCRLNINWFWLTFR